MDLDQAQPGSLPAPVAARLARLAPDQRAAATAPPGPVLCIAPAGSGKTTTLVARLAWLVAVGVDPGSIAAITFNTRAAEELRQRLGPALEPLGIAADGVRVRTFHALGLEILRDAGKMLRLVPRDRVLRAVLPDADPAARRRLDDAFSRLKLDLAVTAEDVAGDPEPGPVARAFVAYERALAQSGSSDFDDLVATSLRILRDRPALLERWRSRCGHLLVDEVQDVDRSQLELALLLAAPANRIFLVGDDDQSIYGWRLADVRRVLGLAARLPGLRRIDLEVNYRCPAPVVARAMRLVAVNLERFDKAVRAREPAPGRLVLAPVATARDAGAEAGVVARLLAARPDDGGTFAVLARTRRELLPAAAHALEAGVPFRADGLRLPIEDPGVDRILAAAGATPADLPLLVRLGRAEVPVAPPIGSRLGDAELPDDDGEDDATALAPLRAALLGWASRYGTLEALVAAIAAARLKLADLRASPPQLVLATAHGTKGSEFDHVAVIGMSEGRFPSPRALADAADPGRALEEERRLCYVAWTRARRSLTLIYEPAAPSRFLLEAFSAGELGDPEPGAK